jgi:hypothetical protein
MTLPTSHHICQGSAHGTVYIGWGGSARYQADATPLACPLEDRNLTWVPQSQSITARRWVDLQRIPAGESTQRRWAGGIDDAGNRFA